MHVSYLMGQSTPKMCHTQEIAFEPAHDEWRPVDEWSEDLRGPHCEPADNCRLCCRPGDSHVEEVLVVHHEALQKVDFLLRHDELTSCEAPTVPECVTAVRRAKILKRLLSQQRSQKAVREDFDGSRREVSAIIPSDPLRPYGEDEDPSDEENEQPLGRLAPNDYALLPHRNLDQRFPKGLDMWTLSRGPDQQIMQQAVLMQKLDWDSPVLRVTGERIQTVFPLANVMCVELMSNLDVGQCVLPEEPHILPTAAGFEREERDVYVYLTAKRDQKASEKTHHFAFQNAQDAHEFRSWMRTFYPSQVICASDGDPNALGGI